MRGGGAERVQLAIMRHLVAAGHEVDLILAHEGGILLSLLPPEVRVFELRARRLAAAFPGLVRYLRAEQPWSLQAIMWPCTVIAAAARIAARSAARLILSDHTMLSVHYPKPRQRVAMRLSMAAFYPRADKIIAVSQGAAADVARLAGLPADALEVVYNPIDLPDEVTEKAAWQEFPAAQGSRIISAGALKPEKNHELLIRAFAQLLVRRPDAQLLIIGEGALRPRLEALRVELGLGDKVRLTGFQLDPWPYYASADLFVLSSNNEGLPLVLVEAMHAGLRLVSTDCADGVSEILDGDRFGKLVPVGDEDALAAAMEQALDEPANADQQKARARELAGPRQFARYVELLTA